MFLINSFFEELLPTQRAASGFCFSEIIDKACVVKIMSRVAGQLKQFSILLKFLHADETFSMHLVILMLFSIILCYFTKLLRKFGPLFLNDTPKLLFFSDLGQFLFKPLLSFILNTLEKIITQHKCDEGDPI